LRSYLSTEASDHLPLFSYDTHHHRDEWIHIINIALFIVSENVADAGKKDAMLMEHMTKMSRSLQWICRRWHQYQELYRFKETLQRCDTGCSCKGRTVAFLNLTLLYIFLLMYN